MNGATSPLPIFAAVGVELEYMIVNAETLSVLPVADKLMRHNGSWQSDVDRGALAWSNELVLHVIELKTNGPARSLGGLAERFQSEVDCLNGRLHGLGARLMPTGMHPWMDPGQETRLWPHEHSAIYRAFDRIFDCHRHGWANVQSMHLNLPFADDEEFARLHAGIRLLLPLLPALAASSPIQARLANGRLDNRLQVYRSNAARIPSITGRVIPEPVFNRRDYETTILAKIYRDLAPFDPEGLLQEEFVNARGAIARFGRNSIEIRVIDMQECPAADLAIAAAAVAVLEALAEERWSELRLQESLSTEVLEDIFLQTMAEAGAALVGEPAYLRAFGLQPGGCVRADKLWRHLLAQACLPGSPDKTEWERSLELILDQGCLAHRILRGLRGSLTPPKLHEVYANLCDCLASGTMFTG